MNNSVTYTHENGYSAVLYGTSSMSIRKDGKEVLHTGFRGVNTEKEVMDLLECIPGFIEKMRGSISDFYMEISTEKLDYINLAKHCIGLDRKKPYIRHGKKFYRPYRNYFATGRNHDDWDVMVDAGYAKRNEEQNQHRGYTYWLTREGLDWLGNKLGITIHDEED